MHHKRKRQVPFHLLLLVGLAQVQQVNSRQSQTFVALHHLHQPVSPLLGVIVTLDSRCRCSEKRFGAEDRGQHLRRGAGMITWSRVLLFVRTVMLLIHDYQSQAAERQKQRTPDAYHDVVLISGQHFLVRLGTFAVSETRVIHPQPLTEHAPQAVRQLRGQGYLRHQIQHLFARTDLLLSQMDIHLRFARRCHAVKQHRALALPCRLNLLHSPVLLVIERMSRSGLKNRLRFFPRPRLFLYAQLTRQCCAHHLAQSTHVVLRHPMPQPQLFGRHHRKSLGEIRDSAISVGLLVCRSLADMFDDAGHQFLLAQRHYHTLSADRCLLAQRRNKIRETAFNGIW